MFDGYHEARIDLETNEIFDTTEQPHWCTEVSEHLRPLHHGAIPRPHGAIPHGAIPHGAIPHGAIPHGVNYS